ncbi:MAG: hypothetical protein Ct9H90mP20_6060 [Candidatus Neomarinimicrobiota bacterium]|nr:MAG: hypothetical protein Ct9H90mP20_6060 [Candidatus Neomarinimicrobiota bacterium]
MVVKGVGTSGTNRTDITISNADVSRLIWQIEIIKYSMIAEYSY